MGYFKDTIYIIDHKDISILEDNVSLMEKCLKDLEHYLCEAATEDLRYRLDYIVDSYVSRAKQKLNFWELKLKSRFDNKTNQQANMLDFLCFENGDTFNSKVVKLSLPETCCGNKVIIHPCLFGRVNQFDNGSCPDHMSTYPKIWENFGPNSQHTKNVKAFNAVGQKGNGCTCISCGMYNQYAEPNIDGDKYKCFECRS